MRRALLGTALVLVSGCATYMDAQREQRTLYLVQSDHPGVAILDISVPDEVLARAPLDFANVAGLVLKVARDYADARGGFTVTDSTHLGFKAKWERSMDARPNAAPMKVASMAGVPVGVQAPLVTVVRVVDWKTTTEMVNKTLVDVAHVQLVMSTWTREGREVVTENLDALARAGDPFLYLKAGDRHLVEWYQKSDGRDHFFHQPSKREDLFMNALREAVGVHYYPYFPHSVKERVALEADGPLKPGVQAAVRGAWDEAIAAWKDVAEKDPKAHAALYDMALAKVLKGEDEAAQTLLAQAYALDANMSYGAMLTEVQARLAMRKQILPSGEVSAPAKPAEK